MVLESLQIGETSPFSFFDEQGLALTNFASVGDIVIQSDPIPEGFIGELNDLNTMFITAGGSVDYAIKLRSGKIVKYARNKSSDDNGGFDKIIPTGARLVILINTVGVGVIDLVWDGEIKRIRNFRKEKPNSEIFDLTEPGIA